jgi:hypothetical protein
VFGSIPRPARKCKSESQVTRAKAMDAARAEIQREFIRRMVALGLRYKEHMAANVMIFRNCLLVQESVFTGAVQNNWNPILLSKSLMIQLPYKVRVEEKYLDRTYFSPGRMSRIRLERTTVSLIFI